MYDTIVAISSPPSGCDADAPRDIARAILRLSGPDAFPLAQRVFESSPPLTELGLAPLDSRKSSCSAKPKQLSAWQRVHGKVRWNGHVLNAQAWCMPAPHSYTREHIVELHLPGIAWLVSALLDHLLAAGARLAQPGEFTRRAFQNGRLTLAQAEAVGALINSLTADEARAYAARLRDATQLRRQDLRAEIEELLSLVELGLDFTHQDAGVLSAAEIQRRLEDLRQRAGQFPGPESAAPESGSLNAGLPRLVLAGPTNAGKSTLFNALLGRSAAIVSSEAHTTRDFVEAVLKPAGGAGDSAALLVDTAGYGRQDSASAAQHLSQTAWNATTTALRCADFVLLVVDQSIAVERQGELATLAEALRSLKPAGAAIVWTKADLPRAWDEQATQALVERGPLRSPATLSVSAASGRGVEELRDFLTAQAAEIAGRARSAAFATAAAAQEAAGKAAAALQRAGEALRAGHGEDVVAVELREALHAFWQAEGVRLRHDAVTEALLDRIFSRFCIGK